MVFRLILAQLILLLAATSLAAQTEKTLVQKGAWRVIENVSNVEGESNYCYAEASAGANQIFLFEGQQNEALTLSVWDDRWDIPLKPITFTIVVDGARWPLDGNSNGGNVAYYFEDKTDSSDLLKAISKGQSMLVLNRSDKIIARFSLSGSSVALGAFNDCWSRAQKVQKAASDPFGANANAVQYGGTLKDTSGNIFSVAKAPEGSGTVLESTNMSETKHESFGLYKDCKSFSFRYGYGTWAPENTGFKVNFNGASFRFPNKTFPIEQNNC